MRSLSSTAFGQLAPTQVGGLTSTQIGSLSTSVIAGLTTTQIGYLLPSRSRPDDQPAGLVVDHQPGGHDSAAGRGPDADPGGRPLGRSCWTRGRAGRLMALPRGGDPSTRPVLSVLTAAGLLASAAPALAQGGPIRALGHWKIDLKASMFNEALTGRAAGRRDRRDQGRRQVPGLDADRGGRLVWPPSSSPTRRVDGAPTKAVVNAQIVMISVTRDGPRGIFAVTSGKTGRKQTMKVWLADADTLKVEQDVDGVPGPPDQEPDVPTG
ncbi:hypothetical protein ACRAWD_16300 [Caulobacter segnis]